MTQFPDRFLWGAATAGHQVEGGNVNADIWPLEWAQPSLFTEPSGDACDHYHRYPEDIATLDHISQGRVEFGVGRGTFPDTHDGFNSPFAESRERFDETLIFLKRAFGWSNVHYVRANVSPRKDPVAPETLRAIEEQNALDLELYRWATDRFDAAIAADPSFAGEFARFRRSNSLYRPWGHLTTTYPQAVYDRFAGKRRGRREAANLEGPQSSG